MPLPNEAEDTHIDEIVDLITNAREAFVASQEDYADTQDGPTTDHDEPLPAPLPRPEIVEAQDDDEFCQ